MRIEYGDFLIRSWEEGDRETAAKIIGSVLAEYGLSWEPVAADKDVLKVEEFYRDAGGEFWVVERQGNLVGTAAYYPIARGNNAVEIRKMYLLPEARGQGLGKFLLQELETRIAAAGFQEIWLETATRLKEAVKLYEARGYQPASGVETKRCDLIYVKKF